MKGLFGWVRGPSPAPSPDAAELGGLLREHGLPSLSRQLHLSDLVGDADWHLDQDAGTISFGDRIVCAAQVLGTQSDVDDTWRWGWANPSVPEAMCLDAERLRIHPATSRLPSFTDAEHALAGWISPEMLALIASGLTEADGYYRGPYEGGAVFVLLRLPAEAPRPARGDLHRVVRTLGLATLVLSVPIDREMVTRYLIGTGLRVSEGADEVTGRDAGGEAVTVRFDRRGRIRDVRATVGPDGGDRPTMPATPE